MRATLVGIACLLTVFCGCVSNPQGPKPKERYAAFRPMEPVRITHVDRVSSLNNRLDHKTYAGLNWVKGDIRVTPGQHRVSVEYDDETRYIGADKSLFEVREGLRYYIGVRHDRFYLFPDVIKVEEIEGYWDEHSR